MESKKAIQPSNNEARLWSVSEEKWKKIENDLTAVNGIATCYESRMNTEHMKYIVYSMEWKYCLPVGHVKCSYIFYVLTIVWNL